MQQTRIRIEEAIARTPGQIAVLWQAVGADTPHFAHNSALRMVSASTVKVPILLYLLHQVHLGQLQLAQQVYVAEILDDSTAFEQGPRMATLEEIARWMILLSDNTSTNVLLRLLGFDALNAYFAALGLQETRVERLMLDWDAIAAGKNNYTSARDQFRCYALLQQKTILTPALCDLALAILQDNRDSTGLLRYIPRSIPLAHKSGALPQLNHDAGLLMLGDAACFVGVFVQHCPDERAALGLIGTVGKAVYDHERENSGFAAQKYQNC